MIIGGNKDKVIENIKKNINDKELNKKVEINDAVLSEEESKKIINDFYSIRRKKISYFFKKTFAYTFLDIFSLKFNKLVKIEGLENLKDINKGAIITSNHFNPLDSMIVRKVIKKRYKKNMYIVTQETNLAMPGFLGFLMNSLNIIPLSKSTNYIINEFIPNLKNILNKNNYVLIYPEEEMWFNYKKPRPCKRGAYQFAAQANKPIISCFVEMIDTDKKDNDQFNQVKYIIHILKPIIPDENKSPRENSKLMAEIDYNQKIVAYEKAYNKKLNYKFSYEDIAGLKKKD